MAKERILLAYSGGLDTSIIIPWLKEHYDCDVVAMAGDVGIGVDNETLTQKALACGAEKIYIEDLTSDYIANYIYPTLKAQAIYEGKYLLGTSTARPCIAKRMVDIAKAENCTAIAHGCTGKGNDQVRFELAIKALAPGMKIIAPWRMWDIASRDEEIDYAQARNIPVPVTKENNYSMDQNIWHLSHEGMDLEDPANEPQYDSLLHLMNSPQQAPDEPEYVTIDFKHGIPVSVDGVTGDVDMLTYLNKKAGKHGVGIADIVENRLVGMKSRGVYETPGGTVYYAAHRELELLCLERDTLHYKDLLAQRFSEVVYNGQWFHPLREALSAFMDSCNETLTGTVKLKLYKGNVTPAGITSPHSLYDEALSTFDEDDVYNQSDATGFINLFGLPTSVVASMKHRNNLM
ncbi:argininosuccinate synthase [Arcanobacterium haemolyticum]|uniref:Argininosuccinate synthase n=1 Tax=Arcanobacterium haemolyticum (strain ATCC 9345 / DSM 20595 / CCM 5947 / CCUG 17215 / LMG 16163 / NBRC 15585 / NCTC 8452 / 11018) TaxID=644284 RepID=D7BPN7_ARCHD|nr:argininosuccinate synthase [Arcanobacterium haemolyticum]ADH92886.1 argininosuccinate synthase [Arcanobacterium haemolyticum DSM 20595]QCX46969.1 argininosuccinate synthase [Arcanobacterium haemolyticum]SPT75966.1 Argininosuccinate synthase [Arcanobacterium haemolyticum]SQH28365.1 Argininosuccinate synthase [Arcanobacterium haemolyticum]